MKSRWLLAAACAAMPLTVAVAAEPAAVATGATAVTVAAPRIAQERLDRIRQSLAAQIAAWDAGEQAMRAPTPAEAAALAPSTSTPADTLVPLASGGIALRPDISHASLAIAVRGDDGKLSVSHEATAKTSAEAKKGVAHAH
jgi:hypothetical protein